MHRGKKQTNKKNNMFLIKALRQGHFNAHAIKGPRQSGILSKMINNNTSWSYLLIVSLCHWLCTKVELVLRVCDVNIFGQRAPYTIFQQLYDDNNRCWDCVKKKKPSVNIIDFSALIVNLKQVIAHGWAVSVQSCLIFFLIISCTRSNMHDRLKHIIETDRIIYFVQDKR